MWAAGLRGERARWARARFSLAAPQGWGLRQRGEEAGVAGGAQGAALGPGGAGGREPARGRGLRGAGGREGP